MWPCKAVNWAGCTSFQNSLLIEGINKLPTFSLKWHGFFGFYIQNFLICTHCLQVIQFVGHTIIELNQKKAFKNL